jgi:tetratricopeptide (TPR) repeat protein
MASSGLLSIQDLFQTLPPNGQSVAQYLAVFRHPINANDLSEILSLWRLPLTDVADQLAHLATYPDHFSHVQGSYAVANEESRQFLLAFMEESDAPHLNETTLRIAALAYWLTEELPQDKWLSLEALAPQLHLFHLYCDTNQYAMAAYVLDDISFAYLMRWGHYQMVVDLRSRLLGNLSKPELAQSNFGELGSAYASLGNLSAAIAHQEEALRIARENKDTANECVWLTNLGNRYVSLGQNTRALDYFQQAMTIARERADLRSVAVNLVALGTCNVQLGQFQQALTSYGQACDIARQLEDLTVEGQCLSNMGNIYAALGHTIRAIATQDQALAIARESQNNVEISRRLGNLAESLIANNQYAEAIENLREALAIDIRIGYGRGQNYKGVSLAMALLLSDDLQASFDAVCHACTFDTPQNNHNSQNLRGLVAYRLNKLDEAMEAFVLAKDQARTLLDHTPNNYDALYAKGIAYCGIGMASPEATQQERAFFTAKVAFHKARQITSAPGVVAHSYRLFEALVQPDTDAENARLASVRQSLLG